MAKDIREKPIDNLTSDRTWADTTVEVCICGNRTFYIVAMFDDGEISGWFTHAMCFDCNRWVKVPAPVQPAESVVTV